METQINMCCGCFAINRRMVRIESAAKKQCLTQIMNEIQMPKPIREGKSECNIDDLSITSERIYPDVMNDVKAEDNQLLSEFSFLNKKKAKRIIQQEFPLWLCWECEALLSRFTKFKQQVKKFYKAFYQCDEKNQNILALVQEPRLRICVLESTSSNTLNVCSDDIAQMKKEDVDGSTEYDDTEEVSDLQIPKPIREGKSECNVEYLNTTSEEISSNVMNDLKTEVVTDSDHSMDDDQLLSEISFLNKKKAKRMPKPIREGKSECNVEYLSITSERIYPDVMNDVKAEDDQLLSEISFLNKKKAKRKKSPLMKSRKRQKSKVRNVKTKDCMKKTKIINSKVHNNKNSINNGQYTIVKISREELEEERRLEREGESYINAIYKCDSCVKTFPNKDDMHDHFKNKHGKDPQKPIECDICACVFRSCVSHKYHTNKHYTRYQCVVCARVFPRSYEAARHHEETHWPGLSSDLESYGVKVSHEHMTNGSNESKLFPCNACDKIFKWRSSLRKHLETHSIQAGEKRKPYCESCRMSFTSTSNLQKHIQSSAKHQIQLKLRKLGETCKDSSQDKETEKLQLEEIKSIVNKDRQQFACPQCDKKFQWLGNLRRHVRSHRAKDDGELHCVPCNRRFSSIATYKQHLAISKRHVSEDDMQHMCPECGRRFPVKLQLQDHVDWLHRKVFKYMCEPCQKPFKTGTSLYLHKQVVHNKNKAEHLCDHCGKSFPTRGKLGCHVTAVHTAESPYKCKQCGAKFGWNSCLSRHVRRTHGDKTAVNVKLIDTQVDRNDK